MILSFFQFLVLTLLALPPGTTQVPASDAQNLSRMEQSLREARELQTAQPGAALEKLKPLLEELSRLYQRGSLRVEGIRLYQEALLLQARAQARRLAPEPEIVATLKRFLTLNPRADLSQFNPREQAWLDRIRSTESGRLSVKSDPPASPVFYLGQELGPTPLDITLVAGTYHFVLRRQGYREQEFDVAVKTDDILTVERKLQRSAVDLPLSLNAPDITVIVNGRTAGVSQAYQDWLSALPADRQEEYAAIVRQWGMDTSGASFFRLSEIPVEEPTTVEFRSDCYESQRVKVTVAERQVNWNRPIVLLEELRHVTLSKATGWLEISSTPAAAEVWVDGLLQGKTPAKLEVCASMHRVQVIHPAGQYVKQVKSARGQVVKLSGDIKPALTFLGIYALSPESQVPIFLEQDWDTVARRLGLELHSLAYTDLSAADLEALRNRRSLPVEQLTRGDFRNGDLGYLVKQTASEAGRADLLLLGLKIGQKYAFSLFSTLHPIPDLMEIPDLKDESLGYLIAQLNKSQLAKSRMEDPDLGMTLIDLPKGLAILKIQPHSPASKTKLAPGMIIRSVDQKPMDLKNFQFYLRSRNPGQMISLEALSPAGLTLVELPVRFSGSEYPWSLPDGYPNCVLAMLKHLIELEPEGTAAKYANLSIGLGLMQKREWKPALDFLARANLDPQKPGISLGTVLYYQGRCYEELGDSNLAQNHYSRARDFPDATLGTPDGLMVSALAERRLRFLRKSRR